MASAAPAAVETGGADPDHASTPGTGGPPYGAVRCAGFFLSIGDSFSVNAQNGLRDIQQGMWEHRPVSISPTEQGDGKAHDPTRESGGYDDAGRNEPHRHA